jgi:uncharacterized protein YqhQ
MTLLRQFARQFAAIHLLLATENGEETLVGGQAVIEGVMMRSPHAWGIAIRRPGGGVALHSEPLERMSEKHKWAGIPVLRGIMTLGQALSLGVKATRFSTDVALEEIQEPKPEAAASDGSTTRPGLGKISGWFTAVNVLFGVAFFIFMYKYIPLLATTKLRGIYPQLKNIFLFNLVDGLIRIALFLAFMWLISRWSEMHRLFQYHGAEHKTVFAFESGNPLSVDEAQKYVTWHPRCGASFLITLMLISIVFYTLVPVQTFWMRFAIRLALLPVIVGVSYEIIRYAAKHSGSMFAMLTKPGLWLQRITTQPPSDDQVECAIAALDTAMDLEKKRGGELVLA